MTVNVPPEVSFRRGESAMGGRHVAGTRYKKAQEVLISPNSRTSVGIFAPLLRVGLPRHLASGHGVVGLLQATLPPGHAAALVARVVLHVLTLEALLRHGQLYLLAQLREDAGATHKALGLAEDEAARRVEEDGELFEAPVAKNVLVLVRLLPIRSSHL